MTKIFWRAASTLLTLASIAHPLFSDTPDDAFQVSYAANLAVGFSNINITNAGSVNGYEPTGDICVNIYVFAEDQQMISCCSCNLTPNHLQTVSVTDLISNTLTPGAPSGITVGLLATENPTGGACDAGAIDHANLAAGMRAWGTVIHAAPGGGYSVTENHFLPAQLGNSDELDKLGRYCGYIEADGSYYGICKSCSPGAAGAAKQ